MGGRKKKKKKEDEKGGGGGCKKGGRAERQLPNKQLEVETLDDKRRLHATEKWVDSYIVTHRMNDFQRVFTRRVRKEGN